jgi:hypothetical protein
MSRAIAYFSNGLGNLVLMLPALQALRDMTGEPVDLVLPDSWRDSRRPAVEEIAAAWDVIGQVISHPKDPIVPERYEHWFWSGHNSMTDSVLPFKARMRHIPVAKPNWREALVHERDHYLDIVRAMGWRNGNGVPQVEFPLAAGPTLSLTGPVVGICNGAFHTPAWEKKHWPHFADLSTTLRRYFKASIVGVGGPGELDGVPCDIDFCGKLSITETARVIRQCDLFISTDTGCMHVADILEVPTIALFGSTLVSKNGPLSPSARAIIADLECVPCQDTGRFFSCRHNECMHSLSVGDVMHEARRSLR